MRLIRNRGQDEWLLGFGKLGFGRKAAELRIRRGSSAVSFQLSYSSSLVAPDLTLSTFWLRQMPAPPMSIGLKPSYCEPTATPAVLKSLTQAREQPWGKPPCFKHARGCSRSKCAVSVLPLRPSNAPRSRPRWRRLRRVGGRSERKAPLGPGLKFRGLPTLQ